MNMLALDPSSSATGWCIFKIPAERFEYVCSGVYSNALKDRHRKMRRMVNEAINLKIEYTPQIVIYEEPFIGRRNAKGVITQLLIVGAQVAIFAAADVVAYSNGTIKKTIGGHGHSRKNWLAERLREDWGINTTDMSGDETDAIAAAVTHYLHVYPPKPLTERMF